MAIVNTTGTMQTVLEGFNINVTGDIFGTLFIIFIFMVILALMFKMPLIVCLLISTPFVFLAVAYSSSFIVVLIVMIIYFSLFLARGLWFT